MIIMGDTLIEHLFMIIFAGLCFGLMFSYLLIGIIESEQSKLKKSNKQCGECKSTIDKDMYIKENIYHISIPKIVIFREEDKNEGSDKASKKQE